MQDTQKNKEKLLAILQQRQDSVEISAEAQKAQPQKTPETSDDSKKEATVAKKNLLKKAVQSPTPFKLFNLVLWGLFAIVDLALGFIIYIYWL